MNKRTAGNAATRPSCPAILDIEASGFVHDSYPLEIGIAMPDSSTRCFLIRPEPDWTHRDASSEKLHGLNRARLLAHGRPAAGIVGEPDRLLRGMTVYSDAWRHDLSWLDRLYDCVDRVPAFRLETLPAILSPGAAGDMGRGQAPDLSGSHVSAPSRQQRGPGSAIDLVAHRHPPCALIRSWQSLTVRHETAYPSPSRSVMI